MRRSNCFAAFGDLRWLHVCCLTSVFILTTAPTMLVAEGDATASAPTVRDGQHDFDFEIGTWKTHVTRLQRPLTGSTSWTEYEGTTVVSTIWNGHANLAELERTDLRGISSCSPCGCITRNLVNGASRPPAAGWARSAFPRSDGSGTAAASSSIPSRSTDETFSCAMPSQTSRQTPAALNRASPHVSVAIPFTSHVRPPSGAQPQSRPITDRKGSTTAS